MSRIQVHPEQRDAVKELFDYIRRQREFYHLPPEPLTSPTLAEMKRGDQISLDLLVQQALAEHAGKNDLEDWGQVWLPSMIHNRLLPDFVVHTVLGECWEHEEERDLIQNAWTLVEWPAQIGLTHWRMLFGRMGFLCNFTDDEPCDLHSDMDQPSGPLTLYRGSFASEKRGLSWTLDRDRALWFVERGDMAGKGRRMRLWKTTVPADRQYGHFCNRGEHEVVADVRGLKIEADD